MQSHLLHFRPDFCLWKSNELLEIKMLKLIIYALSLPLSSRTPSLIFHFLFHSPFFFSFPILLPKLVANNLSKNHLFKMFKAAEIFLNISFHINPIHTLPYLSLPPLNSFYISNPYRLLFSLPSSIPFLFLPAFPFLFSFLSDRKI